MRQCVSHACCVLPFSPLINGCKPFVLSISYYLPFNDSQMSGRHQGSPFFYEYGHFIFSQILQFSPHTKRGGQLPNYVLQKVASAWVPPAASHT